MTTNYHNGDEEDQEEEEDKEEEEDDRARDMSHQPLLITFQRQVVPLGISLIGQ